MKKTTIGVIFLMMIVSTAYGYTYSDYAWTTNQANGHQYALTLDDSTWAHCESWAIEVGGHLATINSLEEQNWLATTFPFFESGEAMWIGFYQNHDAPDYSEPAGGWRWISTEPVTYTGWYPGEPTDSGPYGEDYACFWYSGGLWNDAGDWIDRPGIIEIPEPASLLLLTLGGLFLRRKK
jgi:hypothetical protein